jgi:alkylhydroperoxidase family enzyme
MPRVSEITDDGGDEVLRDLFEKERAAFGDLLNPTKVFAHTPLILQAAKRLGASIERSNLLPADLRALIYLRVATLNGCPF